MRTPFWVVLLMIIALPAAAADAIGVVASLFDHYDVVGIPEAHHSAENHVFLRQLVVDPRITGRINDIVVEFGNARYQDPADRYVAGGEVQAAELRKIWRDTTVIMAWDPPLYEEFFATVRDVNATLPRDRRIRVLLGDPPIRWEEVKTADDYRRWADRDIAFAAVVEKQVFARRRKALLIIGGMHLLNSRPQKDPLPESRMSIADLLRRSHAKKVFFFWHVKSRLAPASVAPPVARIATGALGNQSFAGYAPTGVMVQKKIDGKSTWVPLAATDWPSVREMTDGLIDYGPFIHLVEAQPETYRDPLYVAELRRRAAIMKEVYGMSFDEQIDEALRKAR